MLSIGASVPFATDRLSVMTSPLSGSATCAPVSARGAPELTLAVVPGSVRTGELSMVTVVICGMLASVPSLTTQLTVRLVSVPELVGLALLEE